MGSSLSDNELHMIAALNVLGDDTRFKIFKLISSNREFCVSEIAASIGVSTSAVSQHFKLFENAGMVQRNRRGQKICYRIRPDDSRVKQLIRIINSPRGRRKEKLYA